LRKISLADIDGGSIGKCGSLTEFSATLSRHYCDTRVDLATALSI